MATDDLPGQISFDIEPDPQVQKKKETFESWVDEVHSNIIKCYALPQRSLKRTNFPKAMDLFKNAGFRRDGISEDKKHPCLKCRKEVNLEKRRFCHDCRSSETYRFAGTL